MQSSFPIKKKHKLLSVVNKTREELESEKLI